VIPQEVGPLVLSTGKGKNNWIHLPLASHLIPMLRMKVRANRP
jgi:hypothetical protein